MAADLFETYAVTVGRHHGAGGDLLRAAPRLILGLMSLPLAHRRRLHRHLDHRHLLRPPGQPSNIMGALYKGLIVTGVLSIPAIAAQSVLGDLHQTVSGLGPA
jgi:K(+)-stimulated pyrophosphate-energized sodium pump